MEYVHTLEQSVSDYIDSWHWLMGFFDGVKSNIGVWLDWLHLLPFFDLQVRTEELEEELEAERAMRMKVAALILQLKKSIFVDLLYISHLTVSFSSLYSVDSRDFF